MRPSIWGRRAGEVGGGLPPEALERRAMDALRARPAGERIAIACSGGADSLALLLLLWAHFPERRGRWLILHFNHRLRGRSSAADARFVTAVARGLGERCVVGAWDRGSGAGARVAEADARAARFAFFEREMKKVRSQTIVLGHQRDDIAETVLMRLSRGSGTGGLAAPRPVQTGAGGFLRLRPLLSVSRIDLRNLLEKAGVPWREDASNEGGGHFRNRVRRRVLPALQQASPQDAVAGMAASRALLEEDDEAIEALLAEQVGQPEPGRRFDLSALRGQPRALARRAVQRWLAVEHLTDVLSRATVADLIDAVRNAREQKLSAGDRAFVCTYQSRLWVEQKRMVPRAAQRWNEVRLRPGETVTGPSGDRLAAKQVRLTTALKRRIRSGEWTPDQMVYLDPGGGWNGFLLVRSWRAGDRYRPLGAPGRSTLQDLFVNRKIPRPLRTGLPVVCRDDSSPVWVPGLPPAHDASLQARSKLAVQLTYTPATAKLDRLTPPPNS